MTFNREKTKSFFKQSISGEYFKFLADGKVISKTYIDALKKGQYGFLNSNVLLVNGWEYSVRYILGPSDEAIYDIIRDNRIYGVCPEEKTIIAVLDGDDYLFFKPCDAHVYFFCIETEEEVLLCNDYNELTNLL